MSWNGVQSDGTRGIKVGACTLALLLLTVGLAAPVALSKTCGLLACASASASSDSGSGTHSAVGGLGITGFGELYVAGVLVDTCTFGIGDSCPTSGEVPPAEGCTVVTAWTTVAPGDRIADTAQDCSDPLFLLKAIEHQAGAPSVP